MKIYGYWHDENLNDFIKNSIECTINNNPYLEYVILNETSAIQFLKNNFNQEVVEAFNRLIPQAFKSDLLRYCLLYHYGGAYIDLKLILNKIDICFFENHEYHFSRGKKKKGFKFRPIENTFIYFKKNKNAILKKMIDKIVDNIKNKNKTLHNLQITGPLMMGEYFIDFPETFKFKSTLNPKRFLCSYGDKILIDNYLEKYYTKKHEKYWRLWRNKNDEKIFNPNLY